MSFRLHVMKTNKNPGWLERKGSFIAFDFPNRQGFRYSLIQELKPCVRDTGVFLPSFTTSPLGRLCSWGPPRLLVSCSLLMIPAEMVPTSLRRALGHRLMPGPVALARGRSTLVRDGVHGHKTDLSGGGDPPEKTGAPQPDWAGAVFQHPRCDLIGGARHYAWRLDLRHPFLSAP